MWTLSEFAELSGDHNPIRLSEHFARKTRFGGRIVRGLYTASLNKVVLDGEGVLSVPSTAKPSGPLP